MPTISAPTPDDPFAHWKLPPSGQQDQAIDQITSAFNAMIEEEGNPLSSALDEIHSQFSSFPTLVESHGQKKAIRILQDQSAPILGAALEKVKEELTKQLPHESSDAINTVIENAHDKLSDQIKQTLLQQKVLMTSTAPTMSLQQALAIINAYNPTSDGGDNLKSLLVQELQYQQSINGSLAQALQDLQNGTGPVMSGKAPHGMGTTDIFMFVFNYLGQGELQINQTDANNLFFQIFSLPVTSPTVADTVFYNINQQAYIYGAEGNLNAVYLLQGLNTMLLSWGSNATPEQMANWVASQSVNNTPLWANGGPAQAYLTNLLGVTPQYLNVYTTYQNFVNQGNTADANLMSSLLQQILSGGSVINWSAEQIASNSAVWQSADAAGKNAFVTLTNTQTIGYAFGFPTNPFPSGLAQILQNHVIAFLNNSANTGSCAADLASFVWATLVNPAGKDVYLQFPTITSEAMNVLSCIALNSPTIQPSQVYPASPLDTIYDELYNLQSLTGPDAAMVKDLLNKIFTTQNSNSNPQSFFNGLVNTNDLYMLYPGATTATINKIYSLFQIQAPPNGGTALDQLYAQVNAQIQNTQDPGSIALLKATLNEISALGSNGNSTDLVNWASKTIVINYPNNLFSNANAATKQFFLNATNTSVINNALTLQSGLPAALSSALTSYINSLVNTSKSGDPSIPAQVVSWISNLLNPALKDVYFQYPGIINQQLATLCSIGYLNIPTNIPTAMDLFYSNLCNLKGTTPADTAMIADLINKIAATQNSNSNPATYFSTLSQHDDLYMLYPDATTAMIDQIYALAKAPAPVDGGTAFDQLYKQIFDQLQNFKNPGDLALLNGMLSEMSMLGSNGNMTDLTNWASQVMVTKYPNNLFTNAGSLAQTLFVNASGTGIIQNALTMQSQLPASLSAALMNYLNNIVSSVKIRAPSVPTQLLTWMNNLLKPQGQDIFFQFPTLTQSGLQLFCSIGNLSVPTNIPTPTDLALMAAVNSSTTDPKVKAWIASLISYIQKNANSQTPISSIQTWFAGQFPPNNDIFFQDTTISNADLSLLFTTILQTTPPTPTPVDQEYDAAMQWANGPPTPPPADATLAKALINQLQNLGSNGNVATVNSWALGIVKGNFANFPGVSQAGQVTFETITQTNVLSSALAKALAWQQAASANPNSQSYLLATQLVNEIKKEMQAGGDMAQLGAWVQSLGNATQDIYMQFSSLNPTSSPPLSQNDVQTLYSIVNLSPAPTLKTMDSNYNALASWANTYGLLGTPLGTALLSQIYAMGSLDGPQAKEAFNTWIRGVLRGTNPLSSQFRALSVLAKSAFEKLI